MRKSFFYTFLCSLVVLSPLFAQPISSDLTTAKDHVAFAQSIYWSALTSNEKQTYLFAFISSSYETRNLANESISTSPRNLHRFNEEIDDLFMVWQNLIEMEDNGDQVMDEFIGWIDLYYEIQANKTRPFISAINYAHQKVRSDDKSVLELFWGKSQAPTSNLPKDEELEQKSIERKIAASEARKSINAAADMDSLMAYRPMGATPGTAFLLSGEEKAIIALAVETECLNKNQPDMLHDPVFLESLAKKHGFDSMNAFNAKFMYAQQNEERWNYMNKQIIEMAFDQNCM